MRILILNWRDIKNPKSGGAEILTHEIAKRWVKLGHKVTLFSSLFPKAKVRETLDRVKIVRSGHPDVRFLFYSVHFQAFSYYQKNKNKFDVVLDEIHGIPFFTPWYVKTKKVVLICEVAADLWIKMFGYLGLLGRIIEKIYLKFIYKNVFFLTISNSTKNELIKGGVLAKNITVLPMGLTIPKKINNTKKEKSLTLIFVGRLSKSKGVEDAIMATSQLSKKHTKIKLWIVGGGDKDYVQILKKMAKKLKLLDKITFFGFVSQEKKFELMGRAHFLLVPSSKEGWGLIVPEAGLVGTPSIGYNVAGLKEVIQDRKTGYLTSNNTPSGLVTIVNKVLGNKNEYKKIRKAAKKLSLSYNWDRTAEVGLKIIKNDELFMGTR